MINHYNDLDKFTFYNIEKINDIPDITYGTIGIGYSYFDNGNEDYFGVIQFDFYWFHIRFEIHNINFYVYTKYGNNGWKNMI